VVVSFSSSPMAARGVNRNGSITFTDTAPGSPHVGAVVGFATP
jgi:hypothetical protein